MTDCNRSYMARLGAQARGAARQIALATTEQKNAALIAAAEAIASQRAVILSVNQRDAERSAARGLSAAMVDRLTLSDDRLDAIIAALGEIAAQEDPIGKIISVWDRPNGLTIERVSVPIGVIGVIYESRPNVTIDAAAIALKAGNAIILRGGSECIETSKALFECFRTGVRATGLPDHVAQFVETSDRSAVGEMLGGLGGNVDLVIPRGGKSLVARVQSDARVPVLSHLDGICHVYVDRHADAQKAIDIVVNSKMRRPGICGAAETLLIDNAIATDIWPKLSASLVAKGCEIRGDESVVNIDGNVKLATDEDWHTEYLAPVLSVAVVAGVNGALAHIEKYSSGHTEAIITENSDTAEIFLRGVDSAIVMHNASTQFADGGEFGLGAEIGIATGRLHARGPVGVAELTTYKNLVRGDGQVRS